MDSSEFQNLTTTKGNTGQPTVLSNAYQFQFGSVYLHGALERWNDAFEMRFGKFEYLKRDGAEQEPLGAGAAKFSFSCVYMGQNATLDYSNLVSYIRSSPRGLLIHPRLGNIKVACRSLKASEDPGKGIDLIEFTLEFEEDQVDQIIAAEKNVSTQQAAGLAQDQYNNLIQSRSHFTPASGFTQIYNPSIIKADSAILQLGTYVQNFISAVTTLVQNTYVDPQLEVLLGRIEIQANTTTILVRATGRTDAEMFPILQAIRSCVASCMELNLALLSQRPPLLGYIVPVAMNLSDIALALYGASARSKMLELQQLNPMLTNHFSIPSGTVLTVSTPQLSQ